MKFTSILFPTDFSDCSSQALPFALELAEKYGARLHVVNVLHDIAIYIQPETMAMTGAYQVFFDALKSESEKSLASLMASIPKSIQSQSSIENGAEDAEILNYAEKNSIDLIVMGTHGRRGVQKLFLGSTAEKIIRQASCPVMTIRPH